MRDDRVSRGIDHVKNFGRVFHVGSRAIRRENYSQGIAADRDGGDHCIRCCIDNSDRSTLITGRVEAGAIGCYSYCQRTEGDKDRVDHRV